MKCECARFKSDINPSQWCPHFCVRNYFSNENTELSKILEIEKKSDRKRTYMVRLCINYNGHNARLMHDHVSVISFTLITIVVHQNFRLLV